MREMDRNKMNKAESRFCFNLLSVMRDQISLTCQVYWSPIKRRTERERERERDREREIERERERERERKRERERERDRPRERERERERERSIECICMQQLHDTSCR